MKKLIVATIIIGVFILYSVMHAQASAVAFVPPASTGSSATSNTNTSTSAPTSSGGTNTPGTSQTRYKNGSYMGSVADAQWGYIQVKAIITNGKIADVQFVQYPNERDRSVMINQYADPQLTSEAIQAQSANVDVVTGATDTSEAFIQSLSDALSQAQA